VSDSGQADSATPLREAHKMLTRRRLLEAAKQCFSDKGFSDATIDDIVGMAGASRATFYLYFKSKDEILAEMFEVDYLEDLFALFDEFPDVATAPALRSWLNRFIDLYRDRRWTMRVWMLADSHQPALREQTNKTTELILDRLGDALASAQRARTAAQKAELRVAAFLFFSQVEQYCYFRILRENNIPEEAAIKVLVSLWQPYLRR
jgi:AcrR family transcriptional regulator